MSGNTALATNFNMIFLLLLLRVSMTSLFKSLNGTTFSVQFYLTKFVLLFLENECFNYYSCLSNINSLSLDNATPLATCLFRVPGSKAPLAVVSSTGCLTARAIEQVVGA